MTTISKLIALIEKRKMKKADYIKTLSKEDHIIRCPVCIDAGDNDCVLCDGAGIIASIVPDDDEDKRVEEELGVLNNVDDKQVDVKIILNNEDDVAVYLAKLVAPMNIIVERDMELNKTDPEYGPMTFTWAFGLYPKTNDNKGVWDEPGIEEALSILTALLKDDGIQNGVNCDIETIKYNNGFRIGLNDVDTELSKQYNEDMKKEREEQDKLDAEEAVRQKALGLVRCKSCNIWIRPNRTHYPGNDPESGYAHKPEDEGDDEYEEENSADDENKPKHKPKKSHPWRNKIPTKEQAEARKKFLAENFIKHDNEEKAIKPSWIKNRYEDEANDVVESKEEIFELDEANKKLDKLVNSVGLRIISSNHIVGADGHSKLHAIVGPRSKMTNDRWPDSGGLEESFELLSDELSKIPGLSSAQIREPKKDRGNGYSGFTLEIEIKVAEWATPTGKLGPECIPPDPTTAGHYRNADSTQICRVVYPNRQYNDVCPYCGRYAPRYY